MAYFDELDSLKAVLPKSNGNDSIEILTQIGRINYRNEHFQEALESFYNAYLLSDKLADEKSKAILINNIAAIYYKTDDLDNALTYFIQSYDIEQNLGNALGESKSLNNIAIIYNELGQLEKSLEYYDKALDIRKSLNDEEGVATIHNNIGLVYVKKGEYNTAISHYKEAEKIFRKEGRKRSVANALGNISRAYMFLKDYDDAIAYAGKSLKYCDSANSILIRMDGYRTLYSIYKETANFAKALNFHEKYEHLNDSLNNAIAKGKIEDLKVKYETEQKVKENKILRSQKAAQEATIRTQKILVISVLVILLLVSILAYVWYKNSLIKKASIKMLEERNAEIEAKHHELERLNQVKNKMFSVISHEVRSPLNSLIGTVDLLTSGYLSLEEFFKLSTELKQKVNQTSNFLNNILVWSKAQMQGITVHKETFSIEKLVNENLDMLKEQANIKGVEFDRDFESGLLANADKNMIGIVTRNLISNAIKFTGKGRRVTVKTYSDATSAVVEVEDHGMGIADEVKPKIFGTESVNGSAEEAGAGLGLVLSKMLIEENGGEIWFTTQEGKGSKFSFSIPIN